MSPNAALLIVDSDEVLRRAYRDQVIAAEPGAVIDEAATAVAALEKVRQRSYDMVLLDGALTDEDGVAACRALRQAGVRAPIVVLLDSSGDGGATLDAGASDYVMKPFRMAALLSRVHAYLHQEDQADAAVLVIGPYEFHPAAKTLTLGSDRKIRLTEKETAILKYLYRTGNKTVARETLLDEVWGYNAAVTTHTLETHVYRLRQKIEVDPQDAQLLITEPGGYRLNP
jgi:DNA-binding response OmpR family regulator